MTEHKGRWPCSESWQEEYERAKKRTAEVPSYSEDQATISIWVAWLEDTRDYILQLEEDLFNARQSIFTEGMARDNAERERDEATRLHLEFWHKCCELATENDEMKRMNDKLKREIERLEAKYQKYETARLAQEWRDEHK